MPLPLILTLTASLTLTIGAVLMALLLVDRRNRQHRARLGRAAMNAGADTASAPAPKSNKPRASRPQGGLMLRIEAQLEQAGLRLRVNELLLQMSLAVLAIYSIAVLALSMPPVLSILFALGGPVIVAVLVIRLAKDRYRAAFIAGLPEALDVFARGLRAGRPVTDSIAIVVDSSKGPVLREFTVCFDELRMGTDLATSLNRLSQRISAPEVSFFAVATALQSETGGNLIETMENLAGQLRDRRQLRKKARALSSEARASAIILASLPFAVALLISILNAAYLAPLYSDPRGQVMAVVACASIGLGIFMMARMGKLDV